MSTTDWMLESPTYSTANFLLVFQASTGRRASRNTRRTSSCPRTTRWRSTARRRASRSRPSSGGRTASSWTPTPRAIGSSCPRARCSSCASSTARRSRMGESTGASRGTSLAQLPAGTPRCLLQVSVSWDMRYSEFRAEKERYLS